MSQSKKNSPYKIPFGNFNHTLSVPRSDTSVSVAYTVLDEITEFKSNYPSVYAAFVEEQRRNLIDFIRTYKNNHER